MFIKAPIFFLDQGQVIVYSKGMEKLKLKKGSKDDDTQKLTKEFTGLSFFLFGILTFIALFSYATTDPSFGVVTAEDYEVQNSIGLAGAYLAGLLVNLFGIGAYICAFFLIAFGAGVMARWLAAPWWVISGYILFGLSFVALSDAWNLHIKAIHGGGFVGHYLYSQAILYFSPTGSALILIFILLLSSQLIFNISWINISKSSCEFIYAKSKEYIDDYNGKDRLTRLSRGWADDDDNKEQKKLDWRKYLALPSFFKKDTDEDDEESEDYYYDEEDDYEDPLDLELYDVEFEESVGIPKDIQSEEPLSMAATKYDSEDESDKKKSKWGLFGKKQEAKKPAPPITLPPVTLLSVGQATDIRPNQKALTDKGEKLISALADYGIQAKMVRATPGPVITLYEIHPAAGIRVSKISGLADDLAMKLKALAVRIQAPIPGTDSVGIEVPNDERANVSFRELIEGNAFHNNTSLLTMALGKNISGSPVAADLSKMPHLLIAGATGAGKSVCINSILISLLYKAKPDEMKLLLIDPKRIELAIYDDLPHLVHPVVTEMELAKNALLWAIEEMNKRFRLLKDLKVRNITSYNEKVAQMPKTLISEELQNSKDFDESTELAYHSYMPYLVIIIDELADLIMSHGKDVESPIIRLAQLARAAGIHIILATQRPSVDVVTGMIKANFPCRISFQVTQKVDSRTILDTAGAETLLGKGDMLFKPGGGKLQRLHGAFVPDDDVTKVVEYWKSKQKPNYKVDFKEFGESKIEASTDFSSRNDISQESIYQEAINILPTMEKVTISGLQRKLRLGFNKAALVKEQLEKDGYIQDR